MSDKDTIYRQAAIDTIMGQPPEPHYPSWYAAQIEKLPAAQPERKKGKWIYDGDCYICDQCKSAFDWWADSQTSNYCPNCGADMRGEQDDKSRSNSNAQTDTRARGMGATDKSSGI